MVTMQPKYALLTISLLLLSGCETTLGASRFPAKPYCAIEETEGVNRLDTMLAALEGAQGLKEDWLIDYAATSERDRLDLMCTREFINKTSESRKQ